MSCWYRDTLWCLCAPHNESLPAFYFTSSLWLCWYNTKLNAILFIFKTPHLIYFWHVPALFIFYFEAVLKLGKCTASCKMSISASFFKVKWSPACRYGVHATLHKPVGEKLNVLCKDKYGCSVHRFVISVCTINKKNRQLLIFFFFFPKNVLTDMFSVLPQHSQPRLVNVYLWSVTDSFKM